MPGVVVSCLSHSLRRVSTTALRDSSIPVVSQEERRLWRPVGGAAGWLGWEAEGATRVAGRGPAYPPRAPGQGTSPHPLVPDTEQQLMAGSGQLSARPGGYLLHWTLSRPLAALFSSSVVFCSCTEVLAASSGSLLRSMITISISGSKHRHWDEPRRPRIEFHRHAHAPDADRQPALQTSSKHSTVVTGAPATPTPGRNETGPAPLSPFSLAMSRNGI